MLPIDGIPPPRLDLSCCVNRARGRQEEKQLTSTGLVGVLDVEVDVSHGGRSLMERPR